MHIDILPGLGPNLNLACSGQISEPPVYVMPSDRGFWGSIQSNHRALIRGERGRIVSGRERDVNVTTKAEVSVGEKFEDATGVED